MERDQTQPKEDPVQCATEGDEDHFGCEGKGDEILRNECMTDCFNLSSSKVIILNIKQTQNK